MYRNKTHKEISRNIYQKYYMHSQDDLDFYPQLARRMSNGHVLNPQPVGQRSDFNFATAIIQPSRFSGINTTPPPANPEPNDHTPFLRRQSDNTRRQGWDFYPMVRRNVSVGENGGVDRLFSSYLIFFDVGDEFR